MALMFGTPEVPSSAKCASILLLIPLGFFERKAPHGCVPNMSSFWCQRFCQNSTRTEIMIFSFSWSVCCLLASHHRHFDHYSCGCAFVSWSFSCCVLLPSFPPHTVPPTAVEFAPAHPRLVPVATCAWLDILATARFLPAAAAHTATRQTRHCCCYCCCLSYPPAARRTRCIPSPSTRAT